LQSINTADQKQLPWLADVPILGALARSAAYQKKETDLVIIVTPRIVRPAGLATCCARRSTAAAANDPEFFLLGQVEITTRWSAPQGPLGRLAPPIGHTSSTFPKGERHVSK
jgi:pilus assembly protein CpaC